MLQNPLGRPVVKLLLAALISTAIAVGIGVTVANRGPLPTLLAHRGIVILEKYIPIQVELERARFSGPLRLVLYNVDISTPLNVGLTEPVHIQEVHLDFSFVSVLRRQHLAGLERVQLISPDLKADYQRYLELVQHTPSKTVDPRENEDQSLPRTDHRPSKVKPIRQFKWPNVALLVRDGRLELQGKDAPAPLRFDIAAYGTRKELQVSRLEVRRGAGLLQASGKLTQHGDLTAKVDLADWLATDLLGWYPMAKLQGRGNVGGQMRIEGTLSKPLISGEVGLRGARFALPGTAPMQYVAVSQATARLSNNSSGWELSALEVATPTGKLSGEGHVTGDQLKINLTAHNLTLPTDIPFVSAWGIGGTAAFNGELAGTIAKPELNGKVVIRKGRLWNQAVDEATGLLRIDADRFQFDKVEVQKGRSRYHLQGALTGLTTSKQAVSARLDSNAGRIEDLLAVMALPVDAKGRLDGTLTFVGPSTGVITAGKVKVSDVALYGEHLDTAEGGFRWGDGQVQLDDINGRLGKGRLQVVGNAALDGSALHVDIDTQDWPVEQVAYLKNFASDWRGGVSFTGALRGNISDPEVIGQVVAKNLYLGKAQIEQVKGPVELSSGELNTSGLVAKTQAGGSWRLYGRVRNVLAKPDLDLDLQVEDESLSALLAMGGYPVPAVLVDGAVHGTVTMQGPVDDAETRLQLRLSERGIDTQDALRLNLRIADRRVSIL